MKKNTIVIAFFLIAALAAACVELLEPGVKASRGKYSLDLSVRCQDPATKAPIAGVDSLHENTLTRVDWFIFKSTSDNATAVLDGVTSYEDTTVTEPILVASVDMEDYIDPSTKTFTGYAFLLANLPASNTHESLAALTLGQLKQLQVSTTLDLLGTDGKFKAQDNFVMASSTAPAQFPSFSLSENSTTATVTAPLSRVAAKITLDISIVSAIDEIKAQMSGRDTLAEEYLQTWYPDVNNIQVYLTYYNQHTTIDRTLYGTEPFSYQDAYFFTYNRYGFTPSISTQDGKWVVAGTPFYSYPMKWTNNDAHAPFIKIILPWRPYKETPTYDENYQYITHDQGGTHIGKKLISATRDHIDDTSAATQEFFYKINLPLEDNTLSSNTWYKIALDVAILGGRTDDVSMELAGKYYVVDWNNPTFQAGGELTQGSYLSLATPRDTFYIYGGNSIEIPVKSSHTLAASITSRKAYLNGSWTTTPKTIGTRTVPTNLSTRGTATPNGRTSVTFTDPLNTTMGNTLDCYPMSFTIDIRHADSSSGLAKVETITVIQYPPIYIEQKPGGNSFVDGYYGNINNRYYGTDGQGGSGGDAAYNQTPYGPITQNGSMQGSMTVINISAFGNDVTYTIPNKNYPPGQENEEYLIADPRQPSGWQADNLIAYYNGTNTTGWTDKQAGSIMIGNTTYTNFIAPKLLVSSRWGRLGNWTNPGNNRFETAQKRCATYQEAGYPAGRWRLPTEAEIVFMVNLQQHGFITNLFTSSRSITAKGSHISVNTSTNTITGYGDTPLAGEGGNSCRCVYDLWYWGDDPVADPATTYTIGVE